MKEREARPGRRAEMWPRRRHATGGLGGQCDYLRRLLAQQAIMMMMIMITFLENDTSLLMHVVVHPCSLCGVPEQLPRGTLKPPPDGTETVVPLHEHRRGRRDVGGQP